MRDSDFARPPRIGDAEGVRVLIVDDDHFVGRTLGRILARPGFEDVVLETDATRAMESEELGTRAPRLDPP
jgi:PleD family two-component response regulator